MGLFSRTKRPRISEFSMQLTKEASQRMHDLFGTKQELIGIEGDEIFFEAFARRRICDRGLKDIKKEQTKLYCLLLLAHAFGAGIHCVYRQIEMGKSMEKFSPEELRSLLDEFSKADAYKMGLADLHYAPQSMQTQSCQAVIYHVCERARGMVPDLEKRGAYLQSAMHVLFNCGVTLVFAKERLV